MRASEAIPLNHSRWGDPEHCCSGGKHNYHFRPTASRAIGALIWCCCKSVLTAIEPEPDPFSRIPNPDEDYAGTPLELRAPDAPSVPVTEEG